MSKLFEKLFVNKLTPTVQQNNSIPDHQFGFRKKHGTIEQTHRLVTVIRKAFEEKKYCSALFIDVSQAFDTVWHEGLLYKIKQLLPLNTHRLLESYIKGRQFTVKENDFISTPQNIKAGVPQGSVLGPLLYLLCTSDLPTNDYTHISTFADDTAIISVHENPTVASQRLQNHISLLEDWLAKWRIAVNEQKCVHITFTLRRQTCPPVQTNMLNIPQHLNVKYLGIHLDRRLTWKTHIDAKITQIKLKTAQLTWLIGRNSKLTLD